MSFDVTVNLAVAMKLIRTRDITKRWVWVLTASCLASAGLISLAFYPGFMSNDSIHQLLQAKNHLPIDNWHPPILVLVWKILLKITGAVPGMLLMQVSMLWTGLFLLCVYLFRATRSKLYSLLPLAIGFAPYVINFSGVIWKDVQMAFALCLAAGLLLHVAGKYSKLVIALVLLLLAYAFGLRYNSLLAILPLAYVAIRRLPAGGYRKTFIAGFVLVLLLGNVLVGGLLKAQQVHPESSVMMDDILHTVTVQSAETIQDRELRAIVAAALARCDLAAVPYNTLLLCVDQNSAIEIKGEKYAQVRSLWLKSLAAHPVAYLRYRVHTFVSFLNPQWSESAYTWHEGVVQNPLGITASNNLLTRLVRSHVQFFVKDFGFIFRPYFWLLLSAGLLYKLRGRSHLPNRELIIALLLSACLYILSYFPLVIGADARYAYWSLLAPTFAVVLYLGGLSGRRSTN